MLNRRYSALAARTIYSSTWRSQVLNRLETKHSSSPAATAPPDSSGTLHSLQAYPAFRTLLLGTLATNSAFWMYQVCVGWLALQLMDSPLFVGLTAFAGGIPLLVVSLP